MSYNTYKRRDLSIVELDGRQCLVIAADSCGAVGEKPGDALKAPPSLAGAMTARVAIMEVLAAGAEIVCVTDCVASEFEPTGREIVRGIAREMEKAGVSPGCLTGSTEENFRAVMTGLGVTAVGLADKHGLKFRPASDGDLFALFGEPLVGAEVIENIEKIVSYQTIKTLVRDENVREISPAGSKGAAYECRVLAGLNGGTFAPAPGGADTLKSAGPAACAVALVSPVFPERWRGENYKVLGRLCKI